MKGQHCWQHFKYTQLFCHSCQVSFKACVKLASADIRTCVWSQSAVLPFITGRLLSLVKHTQQPLVIFPHSSTSQFMHNPVGSWATGSRPNGVSTHYSDNQGMSRVNGVCVVTSFGSLNDVIYSELLLSWLYFLLFHLWSPLWFHIFCPWSAAFTPRRFCG